MPSAIQFAKQGAYGLILHYYGDAETEAEIKSLSSQLERDAVKVVTVPGDIGDPTTSATVTIRLSSDLRFTNSSLMQIVDVGVAAFGRIDVLVSNAGICPFAEFLTMPHAIWERTRQVNLDGSFYVVQGNSRSQSPYMTTIEYLFFSAVANQMKTQIPQGGSIIGISSISALVGGELQW